MGKKSLKGEIIQLKNANYRKPELLAPAKNKQTAFAAIDCGADAIYMGAPAFGARQNAANSIDDIEEVVNYAHKFWAKVHITVNTILTDSEISEAVELIRKLAQIRVDAIIIQDMGLLEVLMQDIEKSPVPQIHMSTQCNNYLPQKVKFFNDIGVTRVILARELSVEQIKQIHDENPTLELESFIHGALCVSMSGQCYLSQYIGGRSANRGECAQPCRKRYDVIDENGNIIAQNIYPLCLKDFNAGKYIDKLTKSGICSFKIEGRLKDTNYVKNIVAYYRKLLGKGTSSGKSFYEFEPNPEKSFNRGFTDYFLNKRGECYNFESPKSKGEYIGKAINVKQDSFEILTEKEIHPQDGLYFNREGCLVNRICAENTNKKIKIYPNKRISIKNGDDIYRNCDVKFEKELSKPVKRQIGLNIKITDSEIILVDEDDICIKSQLPSGETAKNYDKMKETFLKQFSKTGESDFYICDIKIDSEKQLPFMPVSQINQLRRYLFDKLIEKRLEVYEEKKVYQKPLSYAIYFEKEVDYRANIHNQKAKDFYEKCGVRVLQPSFETVQPEGSIELMHCKHCIKYALNLCKTTKKLALKDSYGKIYPLKFNCKNCEMFVLKPE